MVTRVAAGILTPFSSPYLLIPSLVSLRPRRYSFSLLSFLSLVYLFVSDGYYDYDQGILGPRYVDMRVYIFVNDSNDEQATTLHETGTGELFALGPRLPSASFESLDSRHTPLIVARRR